MNSRNNEAPSKVTPVARRSPWPWARTWAIALVTFRQGMRMHLWVLAPLAILVLVIVDVSSPRFDPVFEGMPSAIGTALFVMAVLAALVGIFLATYSIPAEVESKVAHTVTTKPVGCIELTAGKTLGMSLLLLAMLAAVSAGAYGYFLVRASVVSGLARERCEEARRRARYQADLNMIEAVARRGPMQTYRYREPEGVPIIQIRDPLATPQDSDARWILGETGMRLRWDLSATPIGKWVTLYIALDFAADQTQAARDSLETSLRAHRAGDEGTARETFEQGFARLGKAADAWDRAARLWQAYGEQLKRDADAASRRAFYTKAAGGIAEVAETLSALQSGLTEANVAETVSRIRRPRVRPWGVWLELDLVARPPPEEPKQPTSISLELIPMGVRSSQKGADYVVDLKVAGPTTVRVPLILPHDARRDVALRLPLNGTLWLEVKATGPGHLVGARPGAARLVGPSGRITPAPKVPEVVPERFRRRFWLYGRSREPRQVAVFQFRDVPRGIFRGGDVPVEVGFSIGAWSPVTVETTAQITFLKPGTDESLTFPFTPESHHSTILYLEREFWQGGPLEVRLECLTDQDSFGLLPESVRLRLDGGPFFLNFAKAVLKVWLFGSVLAAAGVLLSTRLSWFVSVFGAVAFFAVAMSRDFFLRESVVGQLARRFTREASDSRRWEWIVRHLVPPVPDLRAMLPGESVNVGEVLPVAEFGATLAWACLCVLVMVLIGAYLFRTREVAA